MAKKGPEKKVEDKIKENLKQRGAFVFKHFATGHNEKGIPDIHSVYNGYAVMIEVKAPWPQGIVSVQQKKNLKLISDNGGVAIVTSNPDFVEDVLNMIDNDIKINTDKPTPFINCNQTEEPKVYDNLQFEGVWGTFFKEKSD